MGCRLSLKDKRSLVEKYAGDEFAVLGVNSDQEKWRVRRLKEQGYVTWRNFRNSSTTSQISSEWGLQVWPSDVLVDQAGVIRGFVAAGEDATASIDELLRQEVGE